jgi:hypothetical protein
MLSAQVSLWLRRLRAKEGGSIAMRDHAHGHVQR